METFKSNISDISYMHVGRNIFLIIYEPVLSFENALSYNSKFKVHLKKIYHFISFEEVLSNIYSFW